MVVRICVCAGVCVVSVLRCVIVFMYVFMCVSVRVCLCVHAHTCARSSHNPPVHCGVPALAVICVFPCSERKALTVLIKTTQTHTHTAQLGQR